MKVTVVGTGNVGAALLLSLAYNDAIDRIGVVSRKEETATAAILDVASALPRGAAKITHETVDRVTESDVIVITSGVTQKGKTAKETYQPNLEIARSVITAAPLKKSAVVICLATPVDQLTVDVQKMARLPVQQVIGFGGDLDSNRLQYILRSRGYSDDDAVALGEHGPKAIPVYQGEQEYEVVTQELHRFWLKIAEHVDIVRNLATADRLARLVDSVVTDAKRPHNVCSYQSEFGTYLTWPSVIGKGGAEASVPISLPKQASRALDSLIRERTATFATMD